MELWDRAVFCSSFWASVTDVSQGASLSSILPDRKTSII